jgi:hypothetical protein
MDFAFSHEQQGLRDAVARLCAPFDAQYWLAKDRCRNNTAARASASSRRR